MVFLFCGCSNDSRVRYTIIEISNYRNGYCEYELNSMSFFEPENRMYDSIGKYKIGDTVSVTLTKNR